MKCPFCSESDNKVIDSRMSKDGEVIRRRRECLECGRRFTTYERIEEVLPLVIKKDGRREPFDRMKIIRSDVKVLLSTGFGKDGKAQELLNEGMKGFVQKPYELARLSVAVAGALQGSAGA